MARAKSSHIKCLEGRLDYLHGKLVDEKPERPMGYVRQEIAALNWALPVLKEVLRVNREMRERESSE